MSKKLCPVCWSENTKEYKACGVWELTCRACGYDSAQRDGKAKNHSREREREENAKGKVGR